MELTIEVHREEHDYSVEITGTDVWELQGRWTSARTLRELVDYLEDAMRLCTDDESIRLITRELTVGSQRIEAVREDARPDDAPPDDARPDDAPPDGARPDGARPDGARPDVTPPSDASPTTPPDRTSGPS